MTTTALLLFAAILALGFSARYWVPAVLFLIVSLGLIAFMVLASAAIFILDLASKLLSRKGNA